MTEANRLATLVTGRSAIHEPYHRWVPYRQGFAPELVRSFLREAAPAGPVLDPFSGSGTVPIECARSGVPATGIEAIESLVFVTNAATAERDFPPLPALETESWRDAAGLLELPLHRVALMLAVARQFTATGAPNRGAPPLSGALAASAAMIQEDLTRPVRVANPVVLGDARQPLPFEDQSIGGVLTSPPYLSRHEYTRIAEPFEQVYRYWHPEDTGPAEDRQLPAFAAGRGAGQAESPRRMLGNPRAAEHDRPGRGRSAANEAAGALRGIGKAAIASRVNAYFDDLFAILGEMHRVLMQGAVAWIVIGGARLNDIYVPSDLILADFAEEIGFAVEDIRVARDLVPNRRRFGDIGHVAPRESVLVLRRPK